MSRFAANTPRDAHPRQPRSATSGSSDGGQSEGRVMNELLIRDPLSAPHLRRSPSRNFGFDTAYTPTMSGSGRKRKASEEPDQDRMSTSPAASPSLANRPLPHAAASRSTKRTRTGNIVGRPLPLPRLLETLSAEQMRHLLQNIADQHPELRQEIVTTAPRPSIDSTLSVLRKYESDFREAFPLGNRPTSEYAYNRVRQHLLQLLDALRDYTPHFLPPQESQTITSLNYLDAVTQIIHRLPDWDNYQQQRHKNEAYDEISKAWALVIREAAKRAGGFHLQFGGWDRKLVEHDQKSGGRLEEAVTELKVALGFVQGGQEGQAPPGVSDERINIRQQLLSGAFGQNVGVSHMGW